MIAVVPVRESEIVAGGDEAIAEAGGVCLLVGRGASEAAAELERVAADGAIRDMRALDLADFRPAGWALTLAPLVTDRGTVVLPAAPDGRDLAPRLARALGRPLVACAIRVSEDRADVVRCQGQQIVRLRVSGPFVATLLLGSRVGVGAVPVGAPAAGATGTGAPGSGTTTAGATGAAGQASEAPVEVPDEGDPPGATVFDAEPLAVLPADPAAMDLAEAGRIFGAGAGIGSSETIRLLGVLAAALGASVGATRVVTDAALLGHERQIGTTGVSVRPRCYVAFGVSGAAQHVGGLGSPLHVIAVNLDRSCPMMASADLAIVTDANELLEVLVRRVAPTPVEAVPSA